MTARWILHYLPPNQVQRRLTVATNLLSSFETEENSFISRFAAIEETLVRSYEPEI